MIFRTEPAINLNELLPLALNYCLFSYYFALLFWHLSYFIEKMFHLAVPGKVVHREVMCYIEMRGFISASECCQMDENGRIFVAPVQVHIQYVKHILKPKGQE